MPGKGDNAIEEATGAAYPRLPRGGVWTSGAVAAGFAKSCSKRRFSNTHKNRSPHCTSWSPARRS